MKKPILILALLLIAASAFAQKSFDTCFTEAVGNYISKQYDDAISALNTAKKASGATKDQISKANRLISKCKSAKQKQPDLNISKVKVVLDGKGQTDSIAFVTPGKTWQITSTPEWAEVWTEGDKLYLRADSNESGDTRLGSIELTQGKVNEYILVSQDRRMEEEGVVHIYTIPDRAFIYVDREPGMLSNSYDLREGRHTIRIEKNGYERKDTTIVLGREIAEGNTEFTFKLTPTFASVSVVIKPEEGYTFDSVPTLDISGNTVNLHPGAVNSFNVDKDIYYYELYEGNVIPLRPGQYVLSVSAYGFLPQTRDISVSKGSQNTYEFILTPVTGTLSVSDEEYAEGAEIILDGEKVGTVPMEGLRVMRGKHILSFVKKGYISPSPEYEIEIVENKESRFKAVLEPYSTYSIVSNPVYCKVFLDGEYQGAAPVEMVVREGEHTLRVEKNGFFPYEKRFRADMSETEHRDSISLVEAFPLTIAAGNENLDVTLSQGRTVFAKGQTPETFDVPLSNKPFKVVLTRSNLSKAWRGNVYFNNPDKNQKNILTWGTGAPVLSGDWYIISPKAPFSDSPIQKGFKKIADLKFATMNLFPGMSTSLINGSLYWETNPAQYIHYPAVVTEGGKVIAGEMTPESEGYSNITWIPAVTVLFLNEEFRIGGALTHHLDINMLAKYAWYPSLQFLYSLFENEDFVFTHMSGHNVFLGLELNSRIPVFNAHIKAGVEAFMGQANIARPGPISTATVDYHYANVPYTTKSIDDLQFVVSVGFTLGGKNARGQNILRIF